MNRHRASLTMILLSGMLLTGCYSAKWNTLRDPGEYTEAPPAILSVFNTYPAGVITLEALNPGYDYQFDIGEKDEIYGGENMRFTSVELTLHETMPPGTVLADIAFIDPIGDRVTLKDVDLMRLVPKLDAPGDMIYPELLLEEFNRFGYSFRKEHNEFSVQLAENPPQEILESASRSYRASLTNNCLAPTKWEFAVTTEDYSDFDQRCDDVTNLNQNRILSHSWFYLDKELYATLFSIKNPGKEIDLTIPYDTLSVISEEVTVDFDQLRQPIKFRADTRIAEIGHQSGRVVEPLDIEQYYKKSFGLFMNDKPNTYASILETPVTTTQFRDEGFYKRDTPKEFDLSWMKYVDSVDIDIVDVEGTGAYVQITLTGKWTPYNITIGNIDLAQLDEQKLHGLLFGFNTYPKSRRYNPVQSTVVYDADLLPDDIKPYVLLTNRRTGKWVNNQYKGVEKIYLSYESLERDVLEIYVLSYERITPVWMAKIELPMDLRETVRIRRSLYGF